MSIFSPVSSVSKETTPCLPILQASNSSVDPSKSVLSPQNIFGSREKLGGIEQTHLKLWTGIKICPGLKLRASIEPPSLSKDLKSGKQESPTITENDCDLLDKMEQRFMSFKKNKFMANFEKFENLAKGQAPKFMVIACSDSRVCPSTVLGFQPGEAFVIRNIANLVPPYESGPSETNAALEFAVNSLNVENILVIGHSCCGGIRALMSMHDDVETSSFIGNWVAVGMNARVKTKAAASNLSFDTQCRHCEKESVNCSLFNLLTYPWIEDKVRNGTLSVHGGYYDFILCTFEKWTLDYEKSNLSELSGKVAVKNKSFWC